MFVEVHTIVIIWKQSQYVEDWTWQCCFLPVNEKEHDYLFATSTPEETSFLLWRSHSEVGSGDSLSKRLAEEAELLLSIGGVTSESPRETLEAFCGPLSLRCTGAHPLEQRAAGTGTGLWSVWISVPLGRVPDTYMGLLTVSFPFYFLDLDFHYLCL